MDTSPATAVSDTFASWIELISRGIELLAIVVIVLAIAYATTRYVTQSITHSPLGDPYNRFRVLLGRALLLGLEILVAADIIRTVALQPSLTSITVLGILVVIRTFLSWSLVVEIEGRWPWQTKGEAASAEGAKPTES